MNLTGNYKFMADLFHHSIPLEAQASISQLFVVARAIGPKVHTIVHQAGPSTSRFESSLRISQSWIVSMLPATIRCSANGWKCAL